MSAFYFNDLRFSLNDDETHNCPDSTVLAIKNTLTKI